MRYLLLALASAAILAAPFAFVQLELSGAWPTRPWHRLAIFISVLPWEQPGGLKQPCCIYYSCSDEGVPFVRRSSLLPDWPEKVVNSPG